MQVYRCCTAVQCNLTCKVQIASHQCCTAVQCNLTCTMQIAGHQCCTAVQCNITCTVQIASHQCSTAITYCECGTKCEFGSKRTAVRLNNSDVHTVTIQRYIHHEFNSFIVMTFMLHRIKLYVTIDSIFRSKISKYSRQYHHIIK
jgi:hypothetical protein